MYITPTCLDPATVEACSEALAKLSELKRGKYPGGLLARKAAITAAVARLEATFTPDEIDAARGVTCDPRAAALAYAERHMHENRRGAYRLRAWAAA